MLTEFKHIPLTVDGIDIIAELANTPKGVVVAARPIFDRVGVDWKTQLRKIEEDPRFNCGHMTTVGKDMKQREMVCLPVQQIVHVLYTINSKRIKDPVVRANLLKFQIHLGEELMAAAFGLISSQETAEIKQILREMQAQIRELQEENKLLREDLAQQKSTNTVLWKARGFESSAAAYEMLAAKERKKISNT